MATGDHREGVSEAMAELRRYRDLGRRRDALIVEAKHAGHSDAQIAIAVGMGDRNVSKILRAQYSQTAKGN